MLTKEQLSAQLSAAADAIVITATSHPTEEPAMPASMVGALLGVLGNHIVEQAQRIESLEARLESLAKRRR